MPPGPFSPAKTPTRRKTSSSGAPKRIAIRLDRMPARTSTLPSNMTRLTLSSYPIARISFCYRRVSRASGQPQTSPQAAKWSKRHLVAALERQDLTRFIGRRYFKPEALENLADLGHLLGVGFSQFPRADPERILHADPYIATDGGRDRCDTHLILAGAEYRPMIVVAEKAIGRALHNHDIFRMRSDAAQNSEHRLNEQRRFHQAAVEKMAQRVQMPNVIALDLEPGAVSGAGGQNVLDVREGVLEHAAARPLEIRFLPVVFELALEPGDHRVKAEIHRAHVERGNLGLESRSRADALFRGHRRRPTGRDVYHDTRALLDYLEERRKRLRCLIRTAILRVARVQVHNRCAGLGGSDGGIRDFLGRHRKVGRHRRGVNRTGNSAGNDDFTRLRHELSIQVKGVFSIGKWTSLPILEYQPYRSHPVCPKRQSHGRIGQSA